MWVSVASDLSAPPPFTPFTHLQLILLYPRALVLELGGCRAGVGEVILKGLDLDCEGLGLFDQRVIRSGRVIPQLFDYLLCVCVLRVCMLGV